MWRLPRIPLLFAIDSIAGVFLGAPLVVGAALKIGYGLALWASFRKLKPPEER